MQPQVALSFCALRRVKWNLYAEVKALSTRCGSYAAALSPVLYAYSEAMRSVKERSEFPALVVATLGQRGQVTPMERGQVMLGVGSNVTASGSLGAQLLIAPEAQVDVSEVLIQKGWDDVPNALAAHAFVGRFQFVMVDMIISAYTAFEVLAKDLLPAVLRCDPKKFCDGWLYPSRPRKESAKPRWDRERIQDHVREGQSY